MARELGKLSAVLVRRKTVPGLYGDGGGLYLQITKSGAKTWIFRFMIDGRRRDMGLGGAETIGLAEAREAARAARQLVRDGVDPIERRRASRLAAKAETVKVMTFRQCAEAYITAHEAAWRNPKHAAQWPASLKRYAFPVLGELPVSAVDTGLVMKVLEPIWATKAETANRVRGRVETILDWARVRGYREGENPARWRGHLDHLLPAQAKVAKGGHHAALPYTEIGTFMTALQEQEGISARALAFAILTAARTGEVLGAPWGEIDLDQSIWIIPAERMKAGREHRIPLSNPAMAILDEMKKLRLGAYVFPGARPNRPLSNMALLMMLRRMGRGDLTAHGFRSTFRDWAAERTTFPAEVAEMALAHSVGDKVEAAYRRGDLFEKRRRLMRDWARACGTGNGGSVVTLQRRT